MGEPPPMVQPDRRLTFDELAVAVGDRVVFADVSWRAPPGLIRLCGTQEAVGICARMLRRDPVAEETRVWGAIRYGPVDHRVRPPVASMARAMQTRERDDAVERLRWSAPPELIVAAAQSGDSSPLDEWVDHLLAEPHSPSTTLTGIHLALARAAARATAVLLVEPGLVTVDTLRADQPMGRGLASLARELTVIIADPQDTLPEELFDATVALSATRRSLPPAPPPWFRWVIPGQLAGMPRPGAAAPLADTVETLRDQGVRRVLGLEEEPEAGEELEAAGFGYRHFPIVDMKAPEPRAAEALVVDLEADRDAPLAVHCKGGLGRTGTILAAILIDRGYSYSEALLLLRQVNSHYVQSAEQHDYLRAIASRRAPTLVERVSSGEAVDEASLDDCPFGVIQLDERGRILAYNAYEEGLARMRREDVLGQSFFFDVAPCTRVRAFYGRFLDGVKAGSLDAQFSFTFSFEHGRREVSISLRYREVDRSVWVLVFPLSVDPTRPEAR